MIDQIELNIKNLREKRPLVLNLTNNVTMDFIANVLLAIGSAPIITQCDDELEELIIMASSISINIGTLDKAFILRCNKALALAKKYNKPVILDPVGAGASAIRTKTAKTYIKHTNIIKGNASEIIALDKNSRTLGVESIHSTDQAKDIASLLASQYNCVVIVSGPKDFITDGKREVEISFGSPLMQFVTGMGCSLAAAVSAFRSVIDDPFESAKIATTYFGICGQLAAINHNSPSSFKTDFLDQLYKADFVKMRQIYVK